MKAGFHTVIRRAFLFPRRAQCDDDDCDQHDQNE